MRGVGDELALERERALEPVEQLSKVSASSFSSSSGPARFRRSCRLVAEISFVVAVIVRSGRRNRPATSQPSTSEAPAMIAKAIPEATKSWWRSELCCTTPVGSVAPLWVRVCRCCQVGGCALPDLEGDDQQPGPRSEEDRKEQKSKTHPDRAS